jgi:apolipoprotein N-acyltransferase
MITINNRNKTISLLFGILAITLSGLNWHLGIASWLAPVFVLFFTRNSKKHALWLLFAGALVAGSISRTCFAVNDKSLTTIITNGLLFALPFTMPYVIDKLIYRNNRNFWYTLVFPAAVVLVEYILSSTLGSWGLTAHTISLGNPLVQSVSIIGLFGLGFIITWFGSLVNWINYNGMRNKATMRGMIIYISILFFLFGYGVISSIKNENAKMVHVAAINGKTDILNVFNTYNSVFDTLSKFPKSKITREMFSTDMEITAIISDSEEALNHKAKIVVWNEYALILNRAQQDSVVQKVCTLSEKYKAYILISFLGQSAPQQAKAFNNTCLLTTPEGEVAWEYLKSGLHPTGEKPFINEGDYKMPYLDTEFGRLGALICYDLDLLPLLNQIREKEIDILLVPSFDWDEITPLHANMAAFVAIQHRISIIRPDGNGYTQIFNSKGKAINQTESIKSNSNIIFADVLKKI